MSRTRDPKPVAVLFNEMYRSLGLQKPFAQFKALHVWNEVVGETIARVTVIERFSSGQLFVKVKNPVWRMELLFRKQELIDRLNCALGEALVKEIIFR